MARGRSGREGERRGGHNTNAARIHASFPQADKINTLTTAAKIEIEPIWATLLAKALESKDIKAMLSNVGAGGAGPAVGAAAPAAAGAAAAEPEKKEEKVEEKEESDDVSWVVFCRREEKC